MKHGKLRVVSVLATAAFTLLAGAASAQFSGRYRSNLKQLEKHPHTRHQIRAGEHLASDYRTRLKPIPESYYRGVPPPPPGYRIGYYEGYVVPTTRPRKLSRTCSTLSTQPSTLSEKLIVSAVSERSCSA